MGWNSWTRQEDHSVPEKQAERRREGLLYRKFLSICLKILGVELV